MVSTRTFYFETSGRKEKILRELLLKWSTNEDKMLSYFKYVKYTDEQSYAKISGIIQFGRRFSKKILRLCFDSENVVMDSLRPVGKPLILTFMQVWVLKDFYRGFEYEYGEFSLGGKKRCLGRAVKPYLNGLKHTDNYNIIACPEIRRLCEFNYMLKRRRKAMFK